MVATVKLRTFAAWACPLLLWAIAFVSTLLVGDPIFRMVGKQTHHAWLGYPGTVSAVAVVAAAAVIETLLRNGWSCEWIPSKLYIRSMVYAIAFVVGLLLWSGLTTSYEVPFWYRAVIVGIVIVPMIALLVSHSMTNHCDLAESSESRSLQWLGRIPLILFITVLVALFALALVEKFL
jgi:hypothetical protein